MKQALVFAAVLTFTLIGLTFGWVSAAHADDARGCYRRPLLNDLPGQTVLVCDILPAPPSGTVRNLPRVGVTTVQHVGR